MKSLLNLLTGKMALLLGLAVASALTIVSCESEEIESPNQDNKMDEVLSDDDISQIGTAHNMGLDAIIHTDKFNARQAAFKNARQDNTFDTLAMLRFLQEETHDFIKKHGLFHGKQRVDVETYGKFSDKELLGLIRGSLSKRTAKQRYYKSLLEKALVENEYDPVLLRETVKQITDQAKKDVLSSAELNSILIMANVLVNSHSYWFGTFANARTSANPCAAIPIVGTTIADVDGGVGGGLFGSVLGPVGTIAGAFSGAMIGSLTAYSISLIDCGINKNLAGPGGSSGGSGVGGSKGGSGYDPGSSGGWQSGQNGSWERDPCDRKRSRTATVPWGRTATVVDPCK